MLWRRDPMLLVLLTPAISGGCKRLRWSIIGQQIVPLCPTSRKIVDQALQNFRSHRVSRTAKERYLLGRPSLILVILQVME